MKNADERCTCRITFCSASENIRMVRKAGQRKQAILWRISKSIFSMINSLTRRLVAFIALLPLGEGWSQCCFSCKTMGTTMCIVGLAVWLSSSDASWNSFKKSTSSSITARGPGIRSCSFRRLKIFFILCVFSFDLNKAVWKSFYWSKMNDFNGTYTSRSSTASYCRKIDVSMPQCGLHVESTFCLIAASISWKSPVKNIALKQEAKVFRLHWYNLVSWVLRNMQIRRKCVRDQRNDKLRCRWWALADLKQDHPHYFFDQDFSKTRQISNLNFSKIETRPFIPSECDYNSTRNH